MSDATSLSLGGDPVVLEPAELDRLVRSLRQLESPGAASIAEEISARMLTGRVQLCPTEAELEALVATLRRLRGRTRDAGSLSALLALAEAQRTPRGLRSTGT